MVSQTSYQQRNQERLAQAIESCQEHEDVFGKFCTVHSTSEKIGVYSVDIDENLYAVSCTCKGNAEHNMDCLHMLAVDRYFDDRRPNFYEMHGIQRPARQQVSTPAATPEPVETHRVARVRGAGGTAWYPEYNSNGTWYRFPEPGTTHAVCFLDESPERAQQWLANRLASVIEASFDAEDRARLAEWNRHNASDAYDVLAETKMLRSTVCGHLVKHDVNRSCGCDA